MDVQDLKRTAEKRIKQYAFVHRNLRQLGFEQRIIFIGNMLTVVFCFFPWMSAAAYQQSWSWRSAFSGETWLMGSMVFLLAGFMVTLTVQDLMEKKWIKLPAPRRLVELVMSGQNVMLIVLSWSVLLQVVQTYNTAQVRFGIAVCLVTQIMAGVAAYLLYQKEQHSSAKAFFSLDEQ